ncbi:cell division protein FtsK [Novimethylophilus kurashikiensis]|uniref:Cell division protein FtsK n=1 Tax=Novimethylophilus kurashikiensis TaxID=1825523 RepID=A0A2R5F555_9PROT|nr:TraM recognition domain-containing protein [Novimethylophilus kurashikiensis]GBG13510.1 cell division protein FtsK [Novimethylophilus kurashikiensis]
MLGHQLLVRMEDLLMPWCGALTGFFSVGAITAFHAEKQIRSEIMTYLSVSGIVGIFTWMLLPEAPRLDGQLWLVLLLTGFALVWCWYRRGIQMLDKLKLWLTRPSQLAREGRTDVRYVASLLPQPREEYDPRQYHIHDGFFMGLSVTGAPIYWRDRLPHLAIAGTSGSGKGRKLQDLAAQTIAKGEAVVYLDPKDDEWGAHALFSACFHTGRPYHYLRLLPESPPQFNLLAGAKAWEIEELFIATFDLSDKGKASDFFKAKDRNAAAVAAKLAAERSLTISELYHEMAADAFWVEDSPGFLGKLREIAGVEAVNAKAGDLSLATLIEEGGGLYVVGSMTLQSVRRVQQMIFVRVQQIASARDRMAGELRTVCVIADEAKYHISRPVLQGLGASRDKGMRVVLAFQSFLDLRDCPDDMDPDMVVGAIIENTPCKLIYRIEDPVTARWLAEKSGIILIDDEARQLERNFALAETGDGGRTIRQAEHFLIDTNKITSLPSGWGVLYGQGLAELCYVSPYRVKKCNEAITATSAISSDINLPDNGSSTTPSSVTSGMVNKSQRLRNECIFDLDE